MVAGGIIFLLCAVICLIISILQFLEKGFLFNNAWIYAADEERERMNQKPHYRQSGVVFVLLSVLSLCTGLFMLTMAKWLLYMSYASAAAVVLYAIVSSVKPK